MIETERLTYRAADGSARRLLVTRETSAIGEGLLPAMLDLHGGAWTWFQPEVDFFWCRALARRGYVMASPEVRSSREAPWPSCLDDARAAFAALHELAPRLRIDRARIGVMGGSTGGHLATMLGLQPHAHVPAWVVALWPILDVEARDRMVRDARFSAPIRWLADRIAGPDGIAPDSTATLARLRTLDRARTRAPTLLNPLVSALHALNARVGNVSLARAILFRTLRAAHDATFRTEAAMRMANPIRALREQRYRARPPMLVVQGDRDPNLTLAMTQAFAQAYRMEGGDVAIRVERGLGHSYGNLPSREAEALVERIDQFLRRRRETTSAVTASPPSQPKAEADPGPVTVRQAQLPPPTA